MRRWTLAVTLLPNLILGGCAADSSRDLRPSETDRRYLLERVGEAAVVQLYADGFEALPLETKVLAFHLTQAAIAGRDIFLDQKYEHALVMRDWLEEIWLRRDALAPETRAELERYTKLFWINNGPHGNQTSRKETLRLPREAFVEAATRAAAAGARLPVQPGESVAAAAGRLFDGPFAAHVDPIATNKSPGEGRDLLEASAANFYRGVTLADLEGFEERYPLNSRLVKRADGTLEEQVWRCGDGASVPPGLYAEPLSRVVGHLRDALAFAPPPTRRALEKLVRWFQTGEAEDFRQYNIAWVADTDAVVDTVNGFIEVYVDPRGQKGAYEGIVSYVNAAKTQAIRTIAENAGWFEQRMPWDAKYKKAEAKGITANAIDVIVETGDSGPVTPVGINLPNPQDIREQYGSKSVNLSNVVEAYDKSTSPSMRKELCFDEAEVERAQKWSALSSDIHTNMHEVIGHASGKVSEKVGGDPAKALKEIYSTLEEARADLVALWFIGDPGTIARGMSPGLETALAEYESYTRNALLAQLRRVPEGDQIEEDHARNRQLVAKWILANSDAIERRERDGKTYFVVTDGEAWRQAAGRLLAEIMRIKAEGDYAAGKALVETYGVKFDPALRDQVMARIAALDPPAYTGFVQPRLTATRDTAGAITAVRVSYPLDLAQQMLEWSGRL